MSAKWNFALLVIVALSLLMMSGLAVSRPEMAPRDVHTGSGWFTKDGGDDPGVVDPWDISVGDDDNWDKPLPGVHGPVDAGTRVVDGSMGEAPEPESLNGHRTTAVVWLKLFFRSWKIAFSVR